MSALKQEPAKKPAARAADKKAVHPVQPVAGEIDYKTMRHDLMAAFPKTLARLAE